VSHRKHVRINDGSQIPPEFGTPRVAVRKSTITTREPDGVETFQKSWGVLTATPGVDVVVVQSDGDEYPVKRDIFAETYEQVEPGRYRKTARSRLAQVPEGVTAVVQTKEGEITVEHPDYVVVGARGEVYANGRDWVAENLEFVD
jgi:hypothetical protein